MTFGGSIFELVRLFYCRNLVSLAESASRL